jgi:hypothetical protein
MQTMTRPRTRLRRLIGRLGRDAFDAAQAYAWRTAAGTGRAGRPDDDPADEPAISVLHELAGVIGDDGLSDRQRVGLCLFLYRQMPSYTVLMYTSGVYSELGDEARSELWAAFRTLLDEPDDRLAAPLAYSLWCNYFEDEARVEEAWAALTEPALGRQATERLLDVAGPVPWRLKAPLYERLAADPSWHQRLFRSLRWSQLDLYGQIEPGEALRLLNRLRLPAATDGLAELRLALEAVRPPTPARTRRAAARRG